MMLRAGLLPCALLLGALSLHAGAKVEIAQVVGITGGPAFQDEFRTPQNLAVDVQNQILVVADTGRQRLVIFDATGRCRGTIACSNQSADNAGPRPNPAEPKSIALDARGRIFVVDSQRPDLTVFSTTGSRIAHYRPAELDELGADIRPRAVACGASGRIYLLVGGSQTAVLIAENDGTVVDVLRVQTSTDRDGTASIAVNAEETLFALVDTLSDSQVHLFDMSGGAIRSFGAHGEGEGTFSAAVHVVFGPGQTVWVTDTLRHSISIFDLEGTFLDRVGGFGKGPGQFQYPSACAFLSATQLVVLERGASRLQVIELSHDLANLDAWPPIELDSQSRPHDGKETSLYAVAHGEQLIEAATEASFVQLLPSPKGR